MTLSLTNSSLLLMTIITINYCTCAVGNETNSNNNKAALADGGDNVSEFHELNDAKAVHVIIASVIDSENASSFKLSSDKQVVSSIAVESNMSMSVEFDTSDDDATLNVFDSKPVVPRFCRTKTFLEVVFRDFCLLTAVDDDDNAVDGELSGENETAGGGNRRVVCAQGDASGTTPIVHIYNSSQLLTHLGARTNGTLVGRCTVVLFYAPWCMFCARLAPHYNALARAFPTLDIVAIDAFHFSSLNSRFGTIAVPNIMVFHNSKAVARFNGTERTLPNIAAFVTNITGISWNSSVDVLPEDLVGPLPSELSIEPDYLLALSWLFVVCCVVVASVRSSTGRRVWNTLVAIGNHGQGQHLHLD